MKLNKIVILAMFFIGIIISYNTLSQAMDSSFNYQGELLDNGMPANDKYDINIDLVDGEMFPWGTTSEHLSVDVINGLFSINVDFGIEYFNGFKDFTITVSIRKTLEGPDGAFTVLGSQTIQAVPMATNLTNGDAQTGEVLTFNGFQWTPSQPDTGPWMEDESVVHYSGNVGIRTDNPEADLNVNAASDGDAFIVSVDEDTKLIVKDNGGVGVGSHTLPPENGLRVEGDAKQSISSNGMMKYMVNAFCSALTTSSITHSYNGVNDSEITILGGLEGDVQCVIDFPTEINDRFWQVSPVANSQGRAAHCAIGASNNQLNCYRYNTITDLNSSGRIMVLVY